MDVLISDSLRCILEGLMLDVIDEMEAKYPVEYVVPRWKDACRDLVDCPNRFRDHVSEIEELADLSDSELDDIGYDMFEYI